MTVEARPRRSYSRLDTWQQCPQAYKAKYVDKLPEEPAVWSVGGTAFHTVAEQLLRGDLGPEPHDGDLFRAWMEAWHTAYAEVINHPRFVGDLDMGTWRAAARGTEDRHWWQEHGYGMVLRFAKWKRTTGAGLEVFRLEESLDVTFGEVPVIAIPDWLAIDEHGQLCIVDYKTGKPPKSHLQLRVYAAAVKAAYDLDATWGLYYMARPGQLIATELTRDHAEIADMFLDFDTRERAGDYELRPGQECRAYQCPTHNPPRSKRR